MSTQAEAGHPALATIFEWLDGAFHGVMNGDPFVTVAMKPGCPVEVGAFDHPVSGRLFDLRAVIHEATPMTNRVIELAACNEGLAPEGYLRLKQSLDDPDLCRLEVRYTCAMAGTNQHFLVQLAARLSRSAEHISTTLA